MPSISPVTKLRIVALVCHAIALGILAYGMKQFYLSALVPPELIRSIAVAVFFVGMALEPKMFFMASAAAERSDTKTPKAKLQGLVFNLGVFLFICSLLMEWLYD